MLETSDSEVRIHFINRLLMSCSVSNFPSFHLQGHVASLIQTNPLNYLQRTKSVLFQFWQARHDYATVQAQCGNVSGTSSNATHQEHSATVISAHRAVVDWSWPKEWNKCARANLHFKKKKKKRHGWEMNGQTFSQNHCKRGKSQHHLHHLCIPSPVSTCRDMLKVSSLQTPSATCRERNQFCFSSDRQDMTPSLGTTHHYVCS